MRGMERREFVRWSADAVAAGTLATPSAKGAAPKVRSATALQPLGKTGLTPTLLGMGTGTRAWDKDSAQIRRGRDVFLSTLLHAYERGLRYYDLADMYGSQPYLRDAMRQAKMPREKLTLLTKTMARDPKALRADIERSRKELDTDYLDIVLLHGVHRGYWVGKMAPCMDELSKAKEQGLVRACGVSCHSLDALKAAAESPWVDVMLSRINPFGVNMDGTPEEVVPVLKTGHANGKGILGMKILGEGEVAGKRAESLHYVLGLGCVDAVTIGFLEPKEIDDAIKHIEAAG